MSCLAVFNNGTLMNNIYVFLIIGKDAILKFVCSLAFKQSKTSKY